jgi:hypothetical protein
MNTKIGCAIAQVVVTGFSSEKPEFTLRAVHMGFVMDKLALGQVSLQVFHFPVAIYSTAAVYSIKYHLGTGQWAH